MRDLSKRIECALREVILDAEHEEALQTISRAERIFSSETEEEGSESLAEELQLQQRFNKAYAVLRERAPERLRKLEVRMIRPEQIEVLGIESRKTLSAISGGVRTEWLGQPVSKTRAAASRHGSHRQRHAPRAYWIPAAWRDVIEQDRRCTASRSRRSPRRATSTSTMVPLRRAVLREGTVRGTRRVTAPATPEKRKEHFPAGSIRVSTDQPLGTLAALLLEPASPDSLFQWGFFDSILSPTEYVEGYIMEPMAEKMLAEDPKLAAEFRRRSRATPRSAADSHRTAAVAVRADAVLRRARVAVSGRDGKSDAAAPGRAVAE